ncbi:AraC family transcriptional regulator [Aliiruegeria haliotis]|uniref:AraC family transcriptional regulator n=1 Tax=Aliiruegeria haliotis TaxID=1280846 RepID=A0A2T0RGY3_9RHOB|nr:AraC family transcriptional regulator [Aliiruegeria haliotis]PRY20433.1 AraC family transcriptional regulator [Aliiruegeria haliotis]
MTDAPAYCFHRSFEPQPKKTVQFDRDYLLYAVEGAIRIRVDGRRWTLPPAFAAWIPAKTPVDVIVNRPMTSCSVLLEPGFASAMPTRTLIFTMSEMARTMIQHSRRWGPTQASTDPTAEPFFRALMDHCAEIAALPSDLWQPEGRSSAVRNAIAYTEAHLAEPLSFANVAAVAGASERSLARHMAEEVGMSWSQVHRRLRMIRAVDLLVGTDLQVLRIAGDVGYSSLSAFNAAFREFSGMAPRDFRRTRVDTK